MCIRPSGGFDPDNDNLDQDAESRRAEKKRKLWEGQQKLAKSFNAIKDDPLNINRTMEHLGLISSIVNGLVEYVLTED